MQLFIIPIVAALGAQIVKLIIDAAKHQFSWKDLDSYGGMPSSHSACVTALALAVGFYEGWTSAAFAVALIFAVVTIRDAVGFRREIGYQARVLNEHLAQIPTESANFPYLKERLGHTPLEALAGAAFGALTTVAYILITR
jgi:hypothetical protein